MTPECKPRSNGYGDQMDCAVHGTQMGSLANPSPCEVTAESWAAYVEGVTR
jgi:hypothetical protein